MTTTSRPGGEEPTPAQRAMRARMAAYALHAMVTDPAAHTAPARRAFLDRFEREVDPDGTLPAAERNRRAELARKAYFTRLALASSRARARRASAAASSRDESPPALRGHLSGR